MATGNTWAGFIDPSKQNMHPKAYMISCFYKGKRKGSSSFYFSLPSRTVSTILFYWKSSDLFLLLSGLSTSPGSINTYTVVSIISLTRSLSAFGSPTANLLKTRSGSRDIFCTRNFQFEYQELPAWVSCGEWSSTLPYLANPETSLTYLINPGTALTYPCVTKPSPWLQSCQRENQSYPAWRRQPKHYQSSPVLLFLCATRVQSLPCQCVTRDQSLLTNLLTNIEVPKQAIVVFLSSYLNSWVNEFRIPINCTSNIKTEDLAVLSTRRVHQDQNLISDELNYN